MADKIQPSSKPVGKSDGIQLGSSSSTITTPDPVFGRYYGSGNEGAKAVNSENILGKK